MKLIYAAGDREIAVTVLEYLLDLGVKPVALMLPGSPQGVHESRIKELCELDDNLVYDRSTTIQDFYSSVLNEGVDLLISIHYPNLIREPLLSLPKLGSLNLHPSLLPYNRGWHTPSWSILERTPIGATLHFIDEGLDTGPIVHQKREEITPEDTADSLYRRLLALELEVFKEAWPRIAAGDVEGIEQSEEGTAHKKVDLFASAIQEIKLDEVVPARELLNRLRALTTSDASEAAYFIEGGQRYRVRVEITRDSGPESQF